MDHLKFCIVPEFFGENHGGYKDQPPFQMQSLDILIKAAGASGILPVPPLANAARSPTPDTKARPGWNADAAIPYQVEGRSIDGLRVAV
ncbi:hypothetical protein [Thiorhodospira sibirica]|uniref:hypothetical protein n=1 Tax=Thiorhodospira sibirica TaxID=154347 RepID=UPI00022C2DC3|nr:hypothetical protein [Thiorhodospira sibirica]